MIAKHCMTIDLEDWYHSYPFGQWRTCEPRIYDISRWLLSELRNNDIRATFFIVGYIAERHPDLVSEVVDDGHEIGIHGYDHSLVFQKTRSEFARDIEKACKAVERAAGIRPTIYRAPEFSVDLDQLWIWDILVEQGVTRDSSLVPTVSRTAGNSVVPMQPFCFHTEKGNLMTEFPLAHSTLFGFDIRYSGGGYFRLLPYFLTRYLFRNSPVPAIFYIHPRDLDASLPKIEGLSQVQKFKVYYGLRSAKSKFSRLIRAFRFSSIEDVYAGLKLEHYSLYE